MAAGLSIQVDSSQIAALALEIRSNRGQVGAKAAAAVRKTMLDIEADAQAMAPVDTGNLRNSISSEMTGDGRYGSIHAEIGPTADYGIYVELGTSRMSPQPYLGPAYDRRVPSLLTALSSIGVLSRAGGPVA